MYGTPVVSRTTKNEAKPGMPSVYQRVLRFPIGVGADSTSSVSSVSPLEKVTTRTPFP